MIWKWCLWAWFLLLCDFLPTLSVYFSLEYSFMVHGMNVIYSIYLYLLLKVISPKPEKRIIYHGIASCL